ncbi:DUF4082 domain-containing protein [Sphaerisporangium sp. NPDC051017]|uniref:DUF4082 domain-containing protein n=1 Tax=Sphaerisporangium sp. NPDC051017 TaxID=3154636 RepID=UPI00344895C9
MVSLKDASGMPIQGSVAGDASKKVFTFTPAQRLTPGTRYTAEIAEATDASANPMTPFIWSFEIQVEESAHWTFNEGSGGTAADSSGKGHTATLSDTARWITGKSGNAVSNSPSEAQAAGTGALAGGSPVSGMTFEDHSDNGYVLLTGADGSQLTYTRQADGTYKRESDPADASKVIRDSPTQFTHTAADGVRTVFTAVSVPGTTPARLFVDTDTPAVAAVDESDPVELGVKFTADKPGLITGVRFYKGPGNTGTHIGNLWTTSGLNLATGTFTDESESGWQTLTFAAPVQVVPGATYVASYFAPVGHYAFNDDYFSTATDSPPLHAPATTEVYGGNGVYAYGPSSTMPSGSYHGGNYWVDVEFVPNQGQPDPALSMVRTSHLFGAAATPGTAASTDPGPLELGVKFTADKPGFITGVRFYKGPGNTGTHIGNLWTASGLNLATGTFTGETESGWQTLTFAAPVQVTSGTTYVASYFAPAGHYAFDAGYFAAATDSPPLHAPATTGVYGGNGVYGHGQASQFPVSTYGGGNYWVDVKFASELTRWVVSSIQPPEEPLAQTAEPVLRTDQSFTVSAWLRWSDKDGDYRILEQKGAHQAPFRLGNTPDRGLVFTFTSADTADATTEGVLSNVEPPVNEWFHLAGVYDVVAKTATLYLNGNLVKSAPVSFSVWNPEAVMTLGTSMRGDLDDVRGYQRPLTAGEVNLLAAGPAAVTSPSAATSQPATAKVTESPLVGQSPRDVEYKHFTLNTCRSKAPKEAIWGIWTDATVFSGCSVRWFGISMWVDDLDDPDRKKKKRMKLPDGSEGMDLIIRATTVINTYLGTRNGTGIRNQGSDGVTDLLTPKDISMWVALDQIDFDEVTGIGNSRLKLSVTAKPGTTDSTCTKTINGDREARVNEWNDTMRYYRFKSESTSGAVRRCSMFPWVNIRDLITSVGPTSFPLWGKLDDDRQNGIWTPPTVRCDDEAMGPGSPPNWREELHVRYTGACIFPDVSRIYQMDVQHAKRGPVAAHVWAAFNTPDITDPKKVPGTKVVPGNWDGKTAGARAPLNRINKKELRPGDPDGRTWEQVQNSERDKACRAAKVVGDCDEFPFNTVKEGPGWGDGNYSVRGVPFSNNRSDGWYLTVFYARYRVLVPEGATRPNGDRIWVSVKGTPTP